MTDSEQRDNQFETRRQKIVQKGFPLYGVGRAVRQGLSPACSVCEAPGCTNPGGAFTSERDGRIYEFCSEACRAAFERPAA
jgi:hypothetical protein